MIAFTQINLLGSNVLLSSVWTRALRLAKIAICCFPQPKLVSNASIILECKRNTVPSSSAVELSLMTNVDLISSCLSQCHVGSSMLTTLVELHILGRNVLALMVQDCRECLDLPGVHFPGLKPLEDILKASFPSRRQCSSTDDNKGRGLTWEIWCDFYELNR